MFLCNTAAERELLARGGLNAHLLNKNFTVADAIFRPLADTQIEFDALDNARLDPRKRHAQYSGREAQEWPTWLLCRPVANRVLYLAFLAQRSGFVTPRVMLCRGVGSQFGLQTSHQPTATSGLEAD